MEPFRQPVLIIRWGTTFAGFVLASPLILDRRLEILAWLLVVVAYTAFRTVRPIHYEPTASNLVQLLLEAGLMAVAVIATDGWDSPLVFSVLTAVSVAGFAAGFGLAIRLAIASALAIGIPRLTSAADTAIEARLFGQWSVELFLVALVAGYARRISGDAAARHTLALDRLGRLADANALLFSLHQVAQDLPSSLDLGEVLESTIDRLRELVRFDVAAILVREEADGSWTVARAHGARLADEFGRSDLPPPIRRAARVSTVVSVPNLLRAGGPGVSPNAGSGLYVAMTARGFLVGVLAIESDQDQAFTNRDIELLAGFAEPVALAIDNARWFSRLRTVGADEERTRIARDLHDRIGQSLAYLGFELDRIVRKNGKGDDIDGDLLGLREDIRGVVREVRDTLYDLRTDVSDDRSIESVLEEFLRRVQDRAQLEVSTRVEETRRLPLPQERELWRIVQEAVINCERHAQATQLSVQWTCDGTSATVVIADNGRGFSGKSGRLDSYGLIGMRERAASIGATLEVDSAPGRGTRVRVALQTP